MFCALCFRLLISTEVMRGLACALIALPEVPALVLASGRALSLTDAWLDDEPVAYCQRTADGDRRCERLGTCRDSTMCHAVGGDGSSQSGRMPAGRT